MRQRAPEIVSIDAGLMKRWRCIIYAAIGKTGSRDGERFPNPRERGLAAF